MNTNERYYGEAPKILGEIKINLREMLHYQYLPIKMAGDFDVRFEDRLHPITEIVKQAILDFSNDFGTEALKETYIYASVKRKYIKKGSLINRTGWHSDAFMGDDLNYVWCDTSPTIFNLGRFNLTQDDAVSMKEMEEQAKDENNVQYPDNTLIRIDQYNIHKVNEDVQAGMRTFVKLSFSKDKYDLDGNAHNYMFDYDWPMRMRKTERNHGNLM